MISWRFCHGSCYARSDVHLPTNIPFLRMLNQTMRTYFLSSSHVQMTENTVLYFISIWTWNTITIITVFPAVPSLSVATHGSRIIGGSYSLICSVARSDSFNSTNIAYQWFSESSTPRSPVENQANLTFNPLQLHHAGQYTCMVTLSGFPNLNGNLSQSVSHNISVQGKLH